MKNKLIPGLRGGIGAALLLLVAACCTTPERVPELDRARTAVQELERQPNVQAAAPETLTKARAALDRAAAVADALVQHRIEPTRLRTVGLGETYPVATNDTAAGMQENRRVEIVVSDQNGDFPEAAENRLISQR